MVRSGRWHGSGHSRMLRYLAATEVSSGRGLISMAVRRPAVLGGMALHRAGMQERGSELMIDEVCKLSVQACETLSCEGLARFDFF